MSGVVSSESLKFASLPPDVRRSGRPTRLPASGCTQLVLTSTRISILKFINVIEKRLDQSDRRVIGKVFGSTCTQYLRLWCERRARDHPIYYHFGTKTKNITFCGIQSKVHTFLSDRRKNISNFLVGHRILVIVDRGAKTGRLHFLIKLYSLKFYMFSYIAG